MSNWEDSIRDLKSMQERMNTLLEETRHSEVPDLVEFSAPAWVPAADAFETDREILVLVDLPGVAREDVRVDVDGPHLVVRGERRMPEGLDRDNVRRIERPYGSFARSFDLPASVDDATITAEHREGVLTVRLPKREAQRNRQFQISVE